MLDFVLSLGEPLISKFLASKSQLKKEVVDIINGIRALNGAFNRTNIVLALF
jgi:hypothetical protein